MEKFEESFSDFSKAIKLDIHGDPSIYFNRGNAFFSMKKY
jgi:hypothetical protein